MTSVSWKERKITLLQKMALSLGVGVTMIGTLILSDQALKPFLKDISQYLNTTPYQVKTTAVPRAFSPKELSRVLNPTPEYSHTNRHFGP